MRILIIRPSNNSRGDIWRKHLEYDVSAKTADILIRKGVAVNAADVLVEKMKAFGIVGLTVNSNTDLQFTKAAKKAKFPVVEPEPKETSKSKA